MQDVFEGFARESSGFCIVTPEQAPRTAAAFTKIIAIDFILSQTLLVIMTAVIIPPKVTLGPCLIRGHIYRFANRKAQSRKDSKDPPKNGHPAIDGMRPREIMSLFRPVVNVACDWL